MKFHHLPFAQRVFLALVVFAVSSCGPKNNQAISMARVFKPGESTTVQAGTEQLLWLNCAGSDVLADSLAAQRPASGTITIGELATVRGGGQAVISAAVKSRLEAEISAAYSEDLQAQTSRLERVLLFAAPGVDEVYQVEWQDITYASIVSYIIDGTTYDVDYVYTLHAPAINTMPMPMPCQPGADAGQPAAAVPTAAPFAPEPVTPQVAVPVTEAPPTAYPLPVSSDWRVRMDAFARQTLDTYSLAGMTVAVHRQGETDWIQAYGNADLDGPIPAAPATLYPIGSLSMQFTAAAVMQLSESGSLDLSAPISQYLAGLPDALQPLTLHQLLTHTSMIYDSPSTVRAKFYDQQDYTSSMLLQGLVPDLYLDTNGLPYLFSYGNYILAGLIVEKVSGLSYPAYLDRYVIGPIGLQHTGYCQPVPQGLAKGYFRPENAFVPFSINTSAVFAAGGLCSTAGDLLTWMDALASGRVVTLDSYRQMTTPPLLPDGTPNLFGYGLFAWQDPIGEAVGYMSAEASYVSFVVSYPQKGLTIVLLSNTAVTGRDVFELIGASTAVFMP